MNIFLIKYFLTTRNTRMISLRYSATISFNLDNITIRSWKTTRNMDKSSFSSTINILHLKISFNITKRKGRGNRKSICGNNNNWIWINIIGKIGSMEASKANSEIKLEDNLTNLKYPINTKIKDNKITTTNSTNNNLTVHLIKHKPNNLIKTKAMDITIDNPNTGTI